MLDTKTDVSESATRAPTLYVKILTLIYFDGWSSGRWLIYLDIFWRRSYIVLAEELSGWD